MSIKLVGDSIHVYSTLGTEMGIVLKYDPKNEYTKVQFYLSINKQETILMEMKTQVITKQLKNLENLKKQQQLPENLDKELNDICKKSILERQEAKEKIVLAAHIRKHPNSLSIRAPTPPNNTVSMRPITPSMRTITPTSVCSITPSMRPITPITHTMRPITPITPITPNSIYPEDNPYNIRVQTPSMMRSGTPTMYPLVPRWM